jgi:hypothetical protein
MTASIPLPDACARASEGREEMEGAQQQTEEEHEIEEREGGREREREIEREERERHLHTARGKRAVRALHLEPRRLLWRARFLGAVYARQASRRGANARAGEHGGFRL